VSVNLRFDAMTVLRQSRTKAISHRLPFLPTRRSPPKPNGARLRPASHYGKALRAFDRFAGPPRSPNGYEIAIPAVSMPKGQTMIVKKTNQPTHRVYAVRKTGQDTGYWAEIGAAWAHEGGFGLKLNLMPVGEADIVMREIKPEDQAEGGAQ
jgi:hypothetical protein